jgi:hypothetical protein
VPLAATWANGLLIYEAAIPWSQLGLASPPRAGQPIGWALTVDNVDASNQTEPSALGMFDLESPNGFGMMTLDGAP